MTVCIVGGEFVALAKVYLSAKARKYCSCRATLGDTPEWFARAQLVHGGALQEPIRHLLRIKANGAGDANGWHPAGGRKLVNVLGCEDRKSVV